MLQTMGWGALALGAPWPSFAALPSRADGRFLVVLQLAGGNDGLNTLVPYAQPAYRKLRPTLALQGDELLPLDDGQHAFNAALLPLHARFKQGQVAIVQGIGYPHPNRSHFESTAVWQTARLDPQREPAGWLGRAFQGPASAPAQPTPQLRALGIGQGGLSPALYSARTPVTALGSLDAFAFKPDSRFPADLPALNQALAALYAGEGPKELRIVREVGRAALSSSEALQRAVKSYRSRVDYPKGPFGDQLRLVAQLAGANLGAGVFHLTLGGFDTHANQKRQQAALLGQLASGIEALWQDCEALGLLDKLAIVTYSEFGRRAQENASGGTDHGTGSVSFVVGTRVAGGFQGPSPDLEHLEGGDIPAPLDFRQLYSAVLGDWLGIRSEPVLGGHFAPLPLFRKTG